MASYKAVFTDLDGTLLDEAGQVAPAVRRVLEQLRARGIPIFVATGRSVCSARTAVKGLGIETPLICYNGAVVYDPASRGWLRHETIDDRVTEGLLEVAEAQALFYFVFHEDAKVTLPPRYPLQSDFYGRHENVRHVDVFEDLPRRSVTKLSIYTEGPQDDRAVMEYLGRCGGDHYVERFKVNTIPGFREFSFHTTDVHARAGGKGAGMRFVMERYGLDPAETIALGDHRNDLSMLEAAGLAVAVGDAPPELLGAADRVIQHDGGQGVARFLATTFDL
jgi:Cof subfamily protein (haloacid dehalogenase superfamily)